MEFPFLDNLFRKTNLPRNLGLCPLYTLSANTPPSTANREEPAKQRAFGCRGFSAF